MLRLFTLASLALLCSACSTPSSILQPPATSAPANAALNAKVFDKAWSLINEHYYDPNFRGVNWPEIASKYRPAALAANDAFERYRVLNQMSGELGDKHVRASLPRLTVKHGTQMPDPGLRYRQINGVWIVTDVIPGSPAERSGVQRGWLVASRDGQAVSEYGLSELLSTRVGVPITFVFQDEQDRTTSVSLDPELMSLDATRFVSTRMPDGSRYLRFDHFNPVSARWLNSEIKAHRDAPGLILDLRNNHGGQQRALRRVMRAFFPNRRPLGQTITRDGQIKTLESYVTSPAHYSGPVVILTSELTASSAEIFSHAMQYHHRATLVGGRTPGVVLGAGNYRLPDGGYLSVSHLDFIGVGGHQLEGIGVTPDIIVEPTLADLRAQRDEALQVASRHLQEAIAVTVSTKAASL